MPKCRQLIEGAWSLQEDNIVVGSLSGIYNVLAAAHWFVFRSISLGTSACSNHLCHILNYDYHLLIAIHSNDFMCNLNFTVVIRPLLRLKFQYLSLSNDKSRYFMNCSWHDSFLACFVVLLSFGILHLNELSSVSIHGNISCSIIFTYEYINKFRNEMNILINDFN